MPFLWLPGSATMICQNQLLSKLLNVFGPDCVALCVQTATCRMHFRMATICKFLTSISAALWSSISLIYRFTSPHMPAHRAQAGHFTGCISLWPEQAELATSRIYGYIPCDPSLCLSIKMKVHSASSNTRIHCVCMDISHLCCSNQ